MQHIYTLFSGQTHQTMIVIKEGEISRATYEVVMKFTGEAVHDTFTETSL